MILPQFLAIIVSKSRISFISVPVLLGTDVRNWREIAACVYTATDFNLSYDT
jgi:hypothetical protein